MSVPLPSAISNASPASVDTELLGGRYSLGHRIGEGGMGVVHAGFDERVARPVAIKLLDMRRADDASVTRFRREAMLLARLGHPHIVSVYDVEATRGLALRPAHG